MEALVVSSIKIFAFAFSMSYVIVCLFKFSPKCGLLNYRSGISVEFLAVKMTVSCLATDGRHLGPGLVTSSASILKEISF
jgi:hypothetical protein